MLHRFELQFMQLVGEKEETIQDMYSHAWLRWWKKCAPFSRLVLTKLYVNPTKPSLVISQDKFSLPLVATSPSMSQWVTTEMGFFLMEDKFMHVLRTSIKKSFIEWKVMWLSGIVWFSHGRKPGFESPLPPVRGRKSNIYEFIHFFEFKLFFLSQSFEFLSTSMQTTNWCFLPCLK